LRFNALALDEADELFLVQLSVSFVMVLASIIRSVASPVRGGTAPALLLILCSVLAPPVESLPRAAAPTPAAFPGRRGGVGVGGGVPVGCEEEGQEKDEGARGAGKKGQSNFKRTKIL